jgi:2-polyprenyl-6-methoxyphenol hydroxylase-like FAD-dependent oxidoreductase
VTSVTEASKMLTTPVSKTYDGPVRGRQDRYVVVGGSVAGLVSALALARAGAAVTVIERDVIPEAGDPEEAFLNERPGVPQAHFLHAFLARMVVTFRDRFPDVMAGLEAAGARIEPMGEGIDMGDGLGLLIARRSTLEWVLRRTVAREPGVETRTGRTVVGLAPATPPATASPTTPPTPPTVTGVVLDDGTTVAGTVIACTGRRGDLNAWLQPHGVTIPERLVESELVYVTRWYAIDQSVPVAPILGDLGYLSYLAMPCDAGTLAVAVAVHPSDRELRACLLDDEGFDRLVSGLPHIGASLNTATARPIRSSRPMAGLVNRLRRFVDDDGRPLVLGLHAVGDAHTTTNPAYGRGCSLAVVQSTLLADAVGAHPDDSVARAQRYEAASAREIEPWFHNSVLMDSMRLQRRRAVERAGVDAGLDNAGQVNAGPDNAGPDFSSVFGQLAWGAIADPVVATGLGRMMNLLVTPEQLFSDADFVTRLSTLATRKPDARRPPAGPTRDELLEAATGAAA